MAFVSNSFCFKCKEVVRTIDGKCLGCINVAEKDLMDEWQSKTLDEKLFDMHCRLLKIEKGSKFVT